MLRPAYEEAEAVGVSGFDVVVYMEVSLADRRAADARSADAKTGGGARDLRFPWAPFEGPMGKIFSEPSATAKKAGVRPAKVTYRRGGVHEVTDLEYWPPTKARPKEGRIARVDKCPELGKRKPKTDKGRVFVLLIKTPDGLVRCTYAYEDDLRRTDEWPEELRLPILQCIDSSLGQRAAVRGFIDTDGATEPYCHEERAAQRNVLG